jgi:hypothetical protein
MRLKVSIPKAAPSHAGPDLADLLTSRDAIIESRDSSGNQVAHPPLHTRLASPAAHMMAPPADFCRELLLESSNNNILVINTCVQPGEASGDDKWAEGQKPCWLFGAQQG